MKWKRRPSLSLWWWWCIHTRTSMDTQTVDTHTLVHFFPSFLSLFFGYFIRFFLEHTLSVSRTRSGTAEWCPPVKREMEAMQQAACVSPAGVTLDDGRSKEKCAAVMFTFFFSLFHWCVHFCVENKKEEKYYLKWYHHHFHQDQLKIDPYFHLSQADNHRSMEHQLPATFSDNPFYEMRAPINNDGCTNTGNNCVLLFNSRRSNLIITNSFSSYPLVPSFPDTRPRLLCPAAHYCCSLDTSFPCNCLDCCRFLHKQVPGTRLGPAVPRKPTRLLDICVQHKYRQKVECHSGTRELLPATWYVASSPCKCRAQSNWLRPCSPGTWLAACRCKCEKLSSHLRRFLRKPVQRHFQSAMSQNNSAFRSSGGQTQFSVPVLPSLELAVPYEKKNVTRRLLKGTQTHTWYLHVLLAITKHTQVKKNKVVMAEAEPIRVCIGIDDVTLKLGPGPKRQTYYCYY